MVESPICLINGESKRATIAPMVFFRELCNKMYLVVSSDDVEKPARLLVIKVR